VLENIFTILKKFYR